jgi:dTDP-4-amino-4,6-dideoxygalactose transaminase
MRIPLSAPDISEADIEAVVGVLRTPRLSIGPRMEEFEHAVAHYTGARHAVAVSSGTAGLHLSLRALGIGAGDEVILPSFTFIAAAHAVLYEKAVPVFADIDPVTLNLDPRQIESRITPRTRAVLAVHAFGYPADLQPILEVAARHGLPVIEDACEAIGAEYRGRKCGSIGRAGIFAFYPNKAITTAEGGMVVTDDDSLAGTVRALRNQGRREDDGWFGHQLLGYNYRLSELQCALGVSQMGRLDAILERRADRARAYSRALEGVEGLILPRLEGPENRIGWFAYVVRLRGTFSREQRDSIHGELTQRGIGCGRYFAPIHRQPLYQGYATAELPITDQVSERTLALPFFNAITDAQISEVSEALREAISRAFEAKARTASCP